MNENSLILNSYILPGLPHLLLAPDKNQGWKKLNEAIKKVGLEIQNSGAEILILYSTYWPSIIGHQIQARKNAEWILVDDQFHELGSIPYNFSFDSEFAKVYQEACLARKLQARTIDYEGFPIDTGSVVALKLINPDNKIPCVIVSSNIYSDRAETVILGKATRDAIEKSGKKAVLVAITSLSNRLSTKKIEPEDDAISSLKDQEWNLKFLEFLQAGRLEDAAQLSRQFHVEARVPKVSNFKPFWWLSAVNGQHNSFAGQVYEYQSVVGTGAVVVGLTPTPGETKDLEFDEDNPDTYSGDRPVL